MYLTSNEGSGDKRTIDDPAIISFLWNYYQANKSNTAGYGYELDMTGKLYVDELGIGGFMENFGMIQILVSENFWAGELAETGLSLWYDD